MDSSPKKPSRSGFDFTTFENENRLKLPKRYKDFIGGVESEGYDGRYVADLPGYSKDAKFKVCFLEPGFDLFEVNDISREEHSEWLPLCPLKGEPQFLAVNVSNEKCPVAMWEHEDGKFHPHSDSLDQFLKGLLKKGQQTPGQKFNRAFKKARKLMEEGKHEQALKLFKSVEDGIPREADIAAEQTRSSYFHCCGFCLMELDRIDEAIEDYHKAVANRNTHAGLDLAAIYIYKRPDADEALQVLRQVERNSLDGKCQFRVIRYKGCINVLKGNREKAEEKYRTILDRYSVLSPGAIETCREDLEEMVRENKPNSEIAKELLDWFKC